MDDRSKVVVASFGAKLSLVPFHGNETSTILFHEPVDQSSGPSAAITQIVGNCREDVLLGDEEHVVQAHFETSALWFGREHGASVVGDDQTDGLSETPRKSSAPL